MEPPKTDLFSMADVPVFGKWMAYFVTLALLVTIIRRRNWTWLSADREMIANRATDKSEIHPTEVVL
jgi:hypothetical protein